MEREAVRVEPVRVEDLVPGRVEVDRRTVRRVGDDRGAQLVRGQVGVQLRRRIEGGVGGVEQDPVPVDVEVDVPDRIALEPAGRLRHDHRDAGVCRHLGEALVQPQEHTERVALLLALLDHAELLDALLAHEVAHDLAVVAEHDGVEAQAGGACALVDDGLQVGVRVADGAAARVEERERGGGGVREHVREHEVVRQPDVGELLDVGRALVDVGGAVEAHLAEDVHERLIVGDGDGVVAGAAVDVRRAGDLLQEHLVVPGAEHDLERDRADNRGAEERQR